MSGKKKLCVDAQPVAEDKSYKNDFTYSFKIDKNYFNCVQLNNDKYELRIDNRTFDILIQEERTGRLREETTQVQNRTKSADPYENDNQMNKFSKFEGVPNNLRRGTVNNVSNNPRISGADDFFGNDFEFNDFSNNRQVNQNNIRAQANVQNKSDVKDFGNFNEFSNKFSNPNPGNSINNKRSITPNNAIKKNVLLDVNDIFNENSKPTNVNSKDVFNQINFDMSIPDNSKKSNFDVFQHNQNVLNNFSLPEDEPEKNFNNEGVNFQKSNLSNMGLFDQGNSNVNSSDNFTLKNQANNNNNNQINDFFNVGNRSATPTNQSNVTNFNNFNMLNQNESPTKSNNMNDFKVFKLFLTF
jgi:hypothetical protein